MPELRLLAERWIWPGHLHRNTLFVSKPVKTLVIPLIRNKWVLLSGADFIIRHCLVSSQGLEQCLRPNTKSIMCWQAKVSPEL